MGPPHRDAEHARVSLFAPKRAFRGEESGRWWPMWFARLTAFLILALPAVAWGDALGDLRATLQRLESGRTLRARVEVKTRRSGGESDKQKQAVGDSSVIVECGAGGLRMSWSPEQIRQSRQAAWEKRVNPDAAKAEVATLTALEANDALDLLDAAEPLRRALVNAVLLEDKHESYDGMPARLLVIGIDLRLEEEGRKLLKESDAKLKLWLDGKGQPLAMDRDLHLRFSKFFLSYRVHDEEVRDFQVAGGRLVVNRSQHDNSGSGLGHTEESHVMTTVTLLDAEGKVGSGK